MNQSLTHTVRPSRSQQALRALAATLLLIGITATMLASPVYAGIIPKTGYVTTRGLVIDEATGAPIYAEIMADGQYGATFGPAVGEMADAYVISADQYRAIVNLVDEIRARPEGQGARVVLRDRYQFLQRTDGNFGFIDVPVLGSETPLSLPVPAPDLDPTTKSVLIRNNNTIQDPRILPSGQGPILLEAPIDISDFSIRRNLPAETKSILLGKNGNVLQISNYDIGFKSRFIKRAQNDNPAASESTANLLRFRPGDRPAGPVAGAYVDAGFAFTYSSATTDTDGMYRLNLYIPPCPGFTWSYSLDFWARLNYTSFDPEAPNQPRHYYFRRPYNETCNGLGAFAPGVGLSGQMALISVRSIIATSASFTQRADFLIDVLMLNGKGQLQNPGAGAISVTSGATEYRYAAPAFTPKTAQNIGIQLDLDQDNKEDWQVLDPNDPRLVNVYLGGRTNTDVDANGNPIAPDLQRVTDIAQDFSDQGLLSAINKDELKDTDVYIYRTATGQLITKIEGLNPSQVLPSETGFSYNMVIPGPVGKQNDYRNLGSTLSEWQEALGLPAELRGRQADALRPGETVQIIAINRPSGYLGSAKVTIQQAGSNGNFGRLDFDIPNIVLRPPNLKVQVKRTYQIAAGLSRGENANYQIGFEGSALASDTVVELTTEWYDHNGRPLPEDLEGYTGQLAKIVGPNILGGSAVADFPISPGKHLQVVRLQGDILGPEHFYVHVFGKPAWKNLGPNAGTAGPLQYRPKSYVPIKVPLYDEVATQRLRNIAAAEGRRASGVAPIYRWAYRPEMQFSVFELAMQGLQVQNPAGQTQLIDLTSGLEAELVEKLLLDPDGVAELLYSLTDPEFTPLPALGPERELVFSLGAEEVRAVLLANGTVRFDDMTHFDALSVSDYFSIRLYQNSDSANILWEYQFPYLDIAVDLNRDGKVVFDKEQKPAADLIAGTAQATDKTTPTIPYRFWINNDLDVVNKLGSIQWADSKCFQPGTTVDGQYQQTCEQWDEDPIAQGVTNTSTAERLNTIESYRDLEDFAPLAIRLGNTEFGDHYTLRLKAVGVGINLFKGSWRDKGDSVAHAYIHNNSATEKQIHAANDANGHVMTLPAGAIKVFDATKIQRYFDSNGVGRFIFEGISASDATCRINAENCYLSVMIYDNQQSEPLLERKLYLDLHDMKDFYQHVTAGPGGAGDLIGDFDAGPIQYDPFLTLHDRTQDIYSGLMPPRNLEKDYTFFVHGWRMLDSEKISFAETTFKRLYWSGYQGRFGALSWPTGWFDKPAYRYDDGPLFYGEFLAGNEQNYGRSEAVARQVGPILTRWIEQHKAENPGQNFHIVAHSMGNVVVSEALRAYTGGGNIVSSYTASESAEVAGAYDQREELLIRHTIRVVDSAPVFFDDCLDAQGEPLTNLGPEQSWRCYNVDFGGDYDMPPDMYRSNYSTTSTTPVAVQHGPTTETAMLAATSNTYYTGISSAANRIINFWNDEDEALRGWEFNQLTKPDFLGVGDWEYRNASRAQCTLTLGVSCPSPLMETSQFFITTGVTERELFWSNTVTPDSAQILSHIIPSRTQAMGQGRNAVASSAPELFGFTNSNQDHSGQFHGYYAERRNGQPFRASYWNRVLRLSLRLDPLSNDDLTGLKNDLVASE